MMRRAYYWCRAICFSLLVAGLLGLFVLRLQGGAVGTPLGRLYAPSAANQLAPRLLRAGSQVQQPTLAPPTPAAIRDGQASPTPAPFLFGVEAADELVLTLTPQVVFATATAAQQATLTAQAAITVTATPTPLPRVDNTVVDAAAATATAHYAAAEATVVAVLTSVDQPGLQILTFTPTPTPVVVTATPTPGNLFLAATLVAQKTLAATTTGTPTPVPDNWRVITPIVAFPTATPANAATAEQLNILATVYAATTGTPDPYREFILITVVTATPTAVGMVAAAQTIVAATQTAVVAGTATPLPRHWLVVTPVVVTITPTPANAATATVQAEVGRAMAILTGSPRPERIVVVATPTAVLRPVTDITLLGDEPLRRAPKDPYPQALLGKILFVAAFNRQERIYAINPDGSALAQVTNRWAYDIAAERDAYSADGKLYAAVIRDPTNQRTQLRFGENDEQPQQQLTAFGTGVAWQPAWSPTANQIAFVSNESSNDEIWMVTRGAWPARQYTDNDGAVDHHPSWSPAGDTIVFSSNRSGTQQLWLMDADGGNQRQLTDYAFEVWNPVWVKYADPYVVVRFAAAAPETVDCLVCLR